MNEKFPTTTFSLQSVRSMRFKITLGIIVILSVILLMIGKIIIRGQQDRMMSQMQIYGTETARFVAQISIIPLRESSIDQLESYVEQLVSGQLISYCEIFGKGDSSLAFSPKDVAIMQRNLQAEDTLVFNQDIMDGVTRMGRVELGLNLKPVLEKASKTSLYIIIAFWIELVLIAFAVSYFIHKSLVSPILKLCKTTSEIASGRFRTSDQASRNDELGVLAKTINTMSTNLEELYKNLEQKVEERTAELSAAKNASEATAENLRVVSSEVQVLLDNSPMAILFVSSDRIIHRVNREFFSIFGYSPEEVIGQSTRLLYNSEEEYLKAAEVTYPKLHRDGFVQASFEMVKKDGTPILCSLRGRSTSHDLGAEGIIWSIEDVTAQMKIEEELLKIKKMESIGVLAGGIAHDFNNLLVAIIGNISLAERLVGDYPKVVELLQNSKNASLRAKDLTIKLLTFAKGGEPVKSIGLLPEILKESASFVLSGSNVKCSYDIDEDLWAVPMDKGQINQVIQNLILNADQSMPHGGTIEISCRNVVLSEYEIAGVASGKYVRLDITDTGLGIEDQYLDNIFDPYFSTKEKSSNKGSGLGLSIVHSIITKHGGTVEVASAKESGTTFTLYLPAVSTAIEKPLQPVPILTEGKCGILLMWDE